MEVLGKYDFEEEWFANEDKTAILVGHAKV